MGALADEYEYLMQSSYEKGEASGYEKGEASGFKKGLMSAWEDFVTYWVGEVVCLVRTKGIPVEEAVDECCVYPGCRAIVAERASAALGRE